MACEIDECKLCVFLSLHSKNMDLRINERVTDAPNFLFTKMFMETSVFYILLFFYSFKYKAKLPLYLRSCQKDPLNHSSCTFIPTLMSLSINGLACPPCISSCPAVVGSSLRAAPGCWCRNQINVPETWSFRSQQKMKVL